MYLFYNQIIVEASNYTAIDGICSWIPAGIFVLIVEYVFLNLVYWYFCIKGVWMFSRWPRGGDDLTSMASSPHRPVKLMLAVIMMDIHYCFVETTAIKLDTIPVYAEDCFLIFRYGVVTIWKCFYVGFNDASAIKHTCILFLEKTG